jgi:hypothetical protein
MELSKIKIRTTHEVLETFESHDPFPENLHEISAHLSLYARPTDQMILPKKPEENKITINIMNQFGEIIDLYAEIPFEPQNSFS